MLNSSTYPHPTLMLFGSTYPHTTLMLSAPLILTQHSCYQLHLSSHNTHAISSTYPHPTLMLSAPHILTQHSRYQLHISSPNTHAISSTYPHPTLTLNRSRRHPYLLSCNSSRADKRKSDAPDSFEFSPPTSNGAAVEHDKGHVPNKGARLAFPSGDASPKQDGVYPQGFPSIVGLIKLLYRSLRVKLFDLNVNGNGFYVFYVFFSIKFHENTFSLSRVFNAYRQTERQRDRQTDIVTLTLRRLMSYIYGAPILDVSRSHTTTQYSR